MRSTMLRDSGARSALQRSRGWRRLLERTGPVHTCDACGERMFVRPDSGLCPICWNGHRPGAAVSAALRAARPAERGDEGAVHEVPSHLALLGVRDDEAEEAEELAAQPSYMAPVPLPPRPPRRTRPRERVRRASGILRSAGSRLRDAAARHGWRSI